jgi:hypothetical protein
MNCACDDRAGIEAGPRQRSARLFCQKPRRPEGLEERLGLREADVERDLVIGLAGFAWRRKEKVSA